MRVLAVEDQAPFHRSIVPGLVDAGFVVDLAGTVADGAHLLALNRYDLVLLSLKTLVGEGLDLLRKIRRGNCDIPVIVLSPANSVADRVKGLTEGADDYLGEPVHLAELVARMRVVLRRPASGLAGELHCDGLIFNTMNASARIGKRQLIVPRREKAILESLMRANGRVVTRAALESSAYGLDEEHGSNVLEANVSRLRRRIKALGGDVGIQVVRGVGYRLASTTCPVCP
ncbi:MAG TPA: response regulator transcription factor [Alphaproteobacteria bacterium]|jgi:DNA-binding response OmpR family regulator|nr:response regulator transcription factor [Alphaproteobacteria bacterium]